MAVIINNDTPQRGYPLPNAGNELQDDVGRLETALGMIDTDMAGAISGAAAAQTSAGSASAAATLAQQQAGAAATQAGSAARTVANSATDTTPGALASKVVVSAPLTAATGSPGADETLQLAVAPATTTTSGVARLATTTEAAGGRPDIALTPAGLAAVLATVQQVQRSPRTAPVPLVSTDRGTLIDFLGGWTQPISASSGLGAGWYVILRNRGAAGVVLTPTVPDLIDGVATFVMYPGEVRLVQCDGTGLHSIVLRPFNVLFGSSGLFTPPPGYSAFDFDGVGAGGGGAGGGSYQPNQNPCGGGGGAGGARVRKRLAAAELAPSEAVSIGAGGAGGSGGVSGAAAQGGSGGTGGSTSFGAHLVALGGAGGLGGGTGGTGATALLGAVSPSLAAGGLPITSASTAAPGTGGAGGGTGGPGPNVPTAGGCALDGGVGGGAGGGFLAQADGTWGAYYQPISNPQNGAAGGAVLGTANVVAGGGPAGGLAAHTYTVNGSPGVAGFAAADALVGTGGSGGGGGGGQGGNGGAGGQGSGGGGGGNGHAGAGGTGGTGGGGGLRIIGVA